MSEIHVQFGDQAATDVVVLDDQHVQATTPPGTGTVDVTVTTVGGASTLTAAYTYRQPPVASGAQPDEGPAAGGDTVTITGTGFAT